jgi:hypothetical protein
MWYSRPWVLQLNCVCFWVAMRSLRERNRACFWAWGQAETENGKTERAREENKAENHFRQCWSNLKAVAMRHFMATKKTRELQNSFWRKNTHTHTHTQTDRQTDRTTVDLASQSRQGSAEVMLKRQQAQWVRKDRAEGLFMRPRSSEVLRS